MTKTDLRTNNTVVTILHFNCSAAAPRRQDWKLRLLQEQVVLIVLKLSQCCPKDVRNLFQSCLKVVKKLSRLKAWVPSTPSKTAGGDGTLAGKPLIACFLSRKFESQNRHLPVCLAPDIRKCPIWNAWPRRHLWCGQWWMITTNCSVQKI